MSLFSVLKEHYIIGGVAFMIPLLIMWIVLVVISIRFLLSYYSEKRNVIKLKRINSTIIFIGSFMFLASLFYQTLGFYGALSAIEAAGDISPRIIMGGLKVSFIAPLHACFFFLIASLIWFIFRNLIKE